MSGTNSAYVSSIAIDPYFVDKSSGQPLAFGTVYFYEDSDRVVPKSVYQLVQGSGTPPNYSYAVLPNPLTLSAVGTTVDDSGNDIPIYYYPFDSLGNQQLYYIEVYDANGLLQYTREAWPFPHAGSGGGSSNNEYGITNQITNPQFSIINFTNPLTYTYSGSATDSIPIAPGWTLKITHSGAGSITITQTAVTGISRLPNNPPFTLDIIAGSNITALQLVQTFSNNPDWAAPQTATTNGYIAASICLGTGTTATVQYVASSGNTTPQTIINATNTSGAYETFTGTIQLLQADSAQNGNTGYDQILINLPVSGTSSITNVQVTALNNNIADVTFEQSTSNRNLDRMYNYYNSLLQYKPIKSFLTGWDFPLNPSQALGWTQSAQTLGGANLSRYILDQTILFTSVDNSISISQSTTEDLIITATADTQIALVQYLDTNMADNVLSFDLSSVISGCTSQVGGITATASLWRTADGSLPTLSSPTCQSLIATLDANGKPATFHGSWTEIYRSGVGGGTSSSSLLGNAQFTLAYSASNTISSYPFSGWSQYNTGITSSVTFFAYVLGFGTLTSGNTISLKSISLVPGNIPTIPAPQTLDEVLHNCRRYYRKSFPDGVVPANAVGIGTNPVGFAAIVTSATKNNTWVQFDTQLRSSSPVFTVYNPVNNNSQVYDAAAAVLADCSGTVASSGANGAIVGWQLATAGVPAVGDLCFFHYTADARLGIV